MGAKVGGINALKKGIELVLQAKRGDREALSTLLIDRQSKMYKTALLYVHNQEDALDIVQETSLQAFLSIKHLRHPQYFDTWLVRILINVSRRFYNRDRPISEVVELTTDCHRQVDLHQDLMQDLAMVPEKYRLVLILFYFNELQESEIAKVLRVPTGTVKSRLNRGREWLREKGDVIREY
ncbi:hypothetical protein IV84_GL001750 [Pediococcus damnosus]|nr:hypothetical protein IV84_GL001750 [Pediococcus damnosus]